MIESIINQPVVSMRAPRGWGGEDLIDNLIEMGFWADASNLSPQSIQNSVPYQPERDNWRKPGNCRIIEVPSIALPVSELSQRDISFFQHYTDNDISNSEIISQWPLLRLGGFNAMKKFIDLAASLQQRYLNEKIICLYFHPWEFIPMQGEHYSLEANVQLKKSLFLNCGNNVLTELKTLVHHYKKRGVQFLTIKDLILSKYPEGD